MLLIHPGLLEELTDYFDEYMELEANARQIVRTLLTHSDNNIYLAYWNPPRVLGETRCAEPGIIHLDSVNEIMAELQITYAIRTTYAPQEQPEVTYWLRIR